jgi:hypothetical protein
MLRRRSRLSACANNNLLTSDKSDKSETVEIPHHGIKAYMHSVIRYFGNAFLAREQKRVLSRFSNRKKTECK